MLDDGTGDFIPKNKRQDDFNDEVDDDDVKERDGLAFYGFSVGMLG